MAIKINIDKAKDISHEIRRQLRNEEFKPYDDIISKQIPGNDFQEAELARAAIREKYNTIQQEINECSDVAILKEIVDQIR